MTVSGSQGKLKEQSSKGKKSRKEMNNNTLCKCLHLNRTSVGNEGDITGRKAAIGFILGKCGEKNYRIDMLIVIHALSIGGSTKTKKR